MSSAADISTNTCGSCGAINQTSDRFCSGCGQSLWEKCPNCGEQTPIGRNFCNSCGHNLKEAIESKIAAQLEQLERAKSLMEEGKYSFALRVLEPLCEASDYRYKANAEAARTLLADCTRDLNDWQKKLDAIPARATRYVGEHRYQEAVELITPIPAGMRTEELKELLQESESKAATGSKARRNLKVALAEKDWQGALYELSTLRDLFPKKEKYQELTTQVAGKILRNADKLTAKGEHAEALEMLGSIPAEYESGKAESLRRTLEELVYLRKLVAVSPLCSSVIGAAIDKIQKLTPEDPRLEKLQSKYKQQRAAKPSKDFHFLTRWMKVREGVFPESIVPSYLPTSIPGSRPAVLAKAGGLFWTAFGLALQGIGEGTETASLTRQSKKSFFGLGGKKKSGAEQAWGVDIGEHSIKLLRLKKGDVDVQIEEARLIPIAESKSSESNAPTAATIFKALDTAVADSALGDVPVVCNVANSDLLARYIDLPSDKPAQHSTFVLQEAQANIPIALDMLDTCYYTFDKQHESSMSQLAMVLALRKTDVESRQSALKQLNLNGVAIVPEPIANYNTLRHLKMLGEATQGTSEAVLMIDIGHLRTNIQLFSHSGSWYRTIDWGIDSITSALASGLKLTHADADALRRNIMRAPSVSETMAILRDACAVPKRELDRSIRAAGEHMRDLKVVQCILTGGGAYQPFLGSFINNENL